MDILQATLAASIRVAKYVPSYGEQPNEVGAVTKCMSTTILLYALRDADSMCGTDFRDKFRGYHVRVM